ncbi:acetate/propionate family kinase [Rothia sp. ZJ1223]|uniref:acetate/propionate family kinase n=1 Tax=Rothia sp. ZJ1223 TaxID=2811098 RepID=UPI0019563FED|nr:acetate kinase [Rothia sp. ZJ1223]MBM7051698.1 acetate kinase [Rothia sp. ZJ1223]
MLVLVINCGSSSVKYQVRDTEGATEDAQVIAKGLIENIGTKIPNHTAALELMAKDLEEPLHGKTIDAIGHRIVHGGDVFSQPVIIDESVIEKIDELSPLAPLHNPAHVQGLKAATATYPGVPQVAVFDTAFHATMPEHVFRYAVPENFYTDYGVRRYGFHGTSHDYVTGIAADFLGIERSEFNAVVAHLGNGASITAIEDGKCLDTSMGYTPLAGLVMGTRSGDIDPSVLTSVLMQDSTMTTERLDTILNKESGLLAIAGNNDMRTVVDAMEAGDERAKLALDMTSYRVAKYIGGYNVAVGGAQALIFTAGIGENSHQFRTLVTDRLGALGIKIDEEANKVRGDHARIISTEDSAIPILVVPTNEEKAIAEATVELVAA